VGSLEPAVTKAANKSAVARRRGRPRACPRGYGIGGPGSRRASQLQARLRAWPMAAIV